MTSALVRRSSSEGDTLTNIIHSYQLWLGQRRYSLSTQKNYLADLSKYLAYANTLPQSISSSDLFSPEILSAFVGSLVGNPNAGRYLASLNQFCLYAVDQQLISHNPLKSILKKLHTPTKPNVSSELNRLVNLFQQHLIAHQSPSSTVKNYINDLNQYISWLVTHPLESQ